MEVSGQLHDPAASIPRKTSPAPTESKVGWVSGASLVKSLSQHNYLISHDRHILFIFYIRIMVISTEVVSPLVSNYHIKFHHTT